VSEDPRTDARSKWNLRWRQKRGDSWAPDSWLLRVRPLIAPGKALDLASGRGDNALYLAAEGWKVTAVDISEEALAQLRREAAHRGRAVRTLCQDLEKSPDLPTGFFDLVLMFYYLHRPLLPALRRAVRPGGMVVLRTFSSAGPLPPPDVSPDFVLRPGELPEEFAGWEILLHEEGLEPSKKGGSLAGIVARKPE